MKYIIMIIILPFGLLSQDFELSWSSYIGGSSTDAIECVTNDSEGNIYIYGYTNSKTFPTTANAFQRNHKGGSDLFLMKFNIKMELIWSTLIGGSDVEYPKNIKFYNDYLWVVSDSRSSNFPITSDAFQKNKNTDYDGVFMKFSLDGEMLYSSFLGSSGYDVIDDVVIDNDENVWFTGRAYGPDFPITSDAEQKSHLTGVDSFISKFDKNGQIIYSSFLGGNHDDFAMDIAINRKSNIIAITGYTNSEDFPIKGDALFSQKIDNSLYDTFICYFNLEGKLIWSSYLGGNGKEYGEHITSDDDDAFYIRSFTNSSEILTSKNTFQKTNSGNFSSYIAKINTKGEFQWGTFLGGSNKDAIDNINNKGGGLSTYKNQILISGFTNSSDFPVTDDAMYKSKSAGTDGFFAKFDENGNLMYSSFLGGDRDEEGRAVLLADNKIYIAGWTESSDFPTTANALNPNSIGSRDGFLTVFEDVMPCNLVFDSEIGFTNLNLQTNKLPADDLKLRLTAVNSFDNGYAFYKNKVNLAGGFESEFSFIISNGVAKIIPVPGIEEALGDTSLPGADGIAVVLAGELPTQLGGDGGKMGYGGFQNTMAIEIDLYQNDEFKDPNGNHIAIQLPNKTGRLYPHHTEEINLALNADILTIKSDSSQTYYCKVVYHDKNLSVYLDSNRKYLEPVIDLYDINLTDYLDLEYEANGYIGFTSATGQAVEIHDILDWSLCTNAEVATTSGVEYSENGLQVFPNPVDDKLQIDFAGQYIGNLEIIISDLLGRIAYRETITNIGSTLEIDVRNLSKGIYNLSIVQENKPEKSIRFIKK